VPQRGAPAARPGLISRAQSVLREPSAQSYRGSENAEG
jgi:hypothetical protein